MMMHACLDVMNGYIRDWTVNALIELPTDQMELIS